MEKFLFCFCCMLPPLFFLHSLKNYIIFNLILQFPFSQKNFQKSSLLFLSNRDIFKLWGVSVNSCDYFSEIEGGNKMASCETMRKRTSICM